MKMNLNNPAFLQSAGNVKRVDKTRFVFVEGENSVQLSANGKVIIESVQGGEVVRETYSALNDTNVTINADEGTEIVIYGAVTKIASYNSYYNRNIFSSLDVSMNTALTYLSCDECTGLTSLDLSKNTALTDLSCNGCTGLTSLDLSENTALTKLSCDRCTGLTSLDLSKSTALTYLSCNGCTGLINIDFSKSTALTYLSCAECTGLTSLDLSKNTALTELSCIECTGLINLDFSKNTALTDLSCNGCTGLTTINGIAVNSNVSDSIAFAITEATSVDGTVTLRQGDEFNQTIIDAAMDKGWDVQYYS